MTAPALTLPGRKPLRAKSLSASGTGVSPVKEIPSEIPGRDARATPARFTPDGSPELERYLDAACTKIAAGIRGLIPDRLLEMILLGGGYGRGEGGVLATPNGDRPYNDLEFYVFLRGNRHLNERRFGQALHVLGEILTPQTGVDVEFKIASLPELERAGVSMFSYDLLMGHRRLAGDPAALARCDHHRAAAEIPVSEATRLMMNRCSGLLFAPEYLEKTNFTAAAADFVRRNIAKAELALGDALLTSQRSYHWSVRERHQLLQRLELSPSPSWLQAVRDRHAAGVEFKLHPVRSTETRETLRAAHAEIAELARQVWLWLEAERLGTAFATVREYARAPIDKCPELPAGRNVLINLKTFGLRRLAALEPFHHPRNRILSALPLLLWEPEPFHDPDVLILLQHQLQTHATTFPAMMEAYRALWSAVN